MERASGTLSPQELKLTGNLQMNEPVLRGTLSNIGFRGLSAYEIAIKEEGYEGTVLEWLDGLKADLEMKLDGTIIYYKRDRNSDWEELFDIALAQADAEALREAIEKKQDAKEGHSLLADTEIERLATLDNYDDAEVKAAIDRIDGTIAKFQSEVSEDTASIIHDIAVLVDDTTFLKNKFDKF